MNNSTDGGQGSEKRLEVVGFGLRLTAFIIDGVLVGILSFTLAFVIGFIMLFALTYGDGQFYPAERLISVSGILISVFYFVAFWAKSGQTPGKSVLGIKVIGADGAPLGWGKAFLRYVGYIINVIVLSIGFVWIAFDKKRQGWHDKIAKTYVINSDDTFPTEGAVNLVPGDQDRHWLWLIIWIIFVIAFPSVLLTSLFALGPSITTILSSMFN
jgi:uncharacterized RDD family membrane protein YckC